MKTYGKPQGLQGKIFDFLATEPGMVAKKAAAFFQGHNDTLYYTVTSCLFYWAIRRLVMLIPALYGGTGSGRKEIEA